MAPNCLCFPVSHCFPAKTSQLRSACDPQKKKIAYRWIDFLRSTSPSVSSIQSQKDRWLRCRRASSRRDSHVRGQQEDTELGLRYNRGLVSALAIDGDGKAKPPEHSRSVSRPFEADEFRASSLDRHGWIRILPESHPSLLRASVSLRPGPQNAQERPHHQGRTQSAARSRVAI